MDLSPSPRQVQELGRNPDPGLQWDRDRGQDIIRQPGPHPERPGVVKRVSERAVARGQANTLLIHLLLLPRLAAELTHSLIQHVY